MEWAVRYVNGIFTRLQQYSSVFAYVCVLDLNSPYLLGEPQKQQSWWYQEEVLLKAAQTVGAGQGCHLKTQMVMKWSKTYENNTEIHSWFRVNLRVWPTDDGIRFETVGQDQ